ncbi:MAG: class II aldolase/adducin family protein [Pseudomonadota bacterium]
MKMKNHHNQDLQLKSDLALAHRIIAYENLHEGTWNHLSVLSEDHPGSILVTPGDRHFSDIYQDDILVMNGAGTVIDGIGTPNSAAWCLHAPIHEARPDAVCIIHLHSTYASALLMQKDVCLDEQGSQVAATLYDDIAYQDSYDGVLSDTEEGEAMARTLEHRNVLALRNHGYICVGETIGATLERAYTFERACQLQLLATGTNRILNQIPKSLVSAVAIEENKNLGGYFTGMKALFERRGW